MRPFFHFAVVLVLLTLDAASSHAVTISFAGLPGRSNQNGEADGTEFNGQGLDLTTQGIAFNVGCAVSCLGADAEFLDDFSGTIFGNFVLPGSSVDAMVDSLSIDLCCNDVRPGITFVDLFDAGGDLVATFEDIDVVYTGPALVSSFRVKFSYDAMYSVSYGQMFAVPEPGTAPLLATSLVVLVVARRLKDQGRYPGPASVR